MSCLPAKKRLTSKLLRFERWPQVDRNIAWGFCPSGTSRMLNARQPQAPNAILYLLISPAMFTFKCRNAARKIKTPPSFLTEAFNLSGNIFTLRVIHIPFLSQRNVFLLPPCRVPIYGLYGYRPPINILRPIMGDISGHAFADTDISFGYPNR